MSLVHHIVAASAAKYGVNVLEISPPRSVLGVGSSVVGASFDSTWGPVDTIVQVFSVQDLLDFFPKSTDPFPVSLNAFRDKQWPSGMKIVRPSVAGQVKALFTALDSGASDSADLVAAHFGTLGNRVTVQWLANADDAAQRDAIVRVTGGDYESPRYLKVSNATGVVTDPGDPFVTMTTAGGATLPPDVGTSSLISGANGSILAVDYTGTSVSNKGTRQLQGDGAEILFCAEVATGLTDATNAELKNLAADMDAGIVVYCTPVAQTLVTILAYVAANSLQDDRSVLAWPEVKQAIDGVSTVVDPNAFVASAIANVEPWVSPGGATSAQFLTKVTGISSTTPLTGASYQALRTTGGIAPILVDKALGAIIALARTTATDSTINRIKRRRLTDYITASLAAFLVFFTETALDVTLSPTQKLGPNSAAQIGAIEEFMADTQAETRIASFSVDPFISATQVDLDAGIWTIDVRVKTFASQETTIIRAQIGPTVQAAA